MRFGACPVPSRSTAGAAGVRLSAVLLARITVLRGAAPIRHANLGLHSGRSARMDPNWLFKGVICTLTTSATIEVSIRK